MKYGHKKQLERKLYVTNVPDVCLGSTEPLTPGRPSKEGLEPKTMSRRNQGQEWSNRKMKPAKKARTTPSLPHPLPGRPIRRRQQWREEGERERTKPQTRPPIMTRSGHLKSGSFNLLEPSGPVQACNGIALPLPFVFVFSVWQWRS